MPTLDTWDSLAVALNINVREIYRARKLPGAPETKDLDEWREYFKSSSRFSADGLPPTSYDKALEAGKLDPDNALKHSRIVEQEIINEIKREELRKTRGDTLAKDAVRAKIEKVTLACIAAVETLPDIYAETLPADQRAAARKLAREWVEVIREKIAAGIRAHG